MRTLLAFALAFALGVPIVSLWKFLFLAGAVLMIWTGELRKERKRLAIAAGILLAVTLVSRFLPRAGIEEGHNSFVSLGDRQEALAKGLPQSVFDYLLSTFQMRVSSGPSCDPERYGCWRNYQLGPMRDVFAFSTESAFRQGKYSRVVDEIGFTGISDLRGGFVNRMGVNYYDAISDIRRDQLPHFVMFEWSPASVGSTLCWEGEVLWEGESGRYDLTASCREITHGDVGRKAFGVSVLRPLQMKLLLSSRLKTAAGFEVFLRLLAFFGILAACVRPNAREAGMPALLLLCVLGVLAYQGRLEPFAATPIHWGGDDGLNHDDNGREILKHLVRGDIGLALQGEEPVYNLKPGLRYFRAVEHAIFGETALGQLIHVLLVPIALFGILALFLSWAFALPLTLFFVLAPFESQLPLGWGLSTYSHLSYWSFAEPLGLVFFLLGALKLLRYHDQPAPLAIRQGMWGNLCLAVSIWLRPNLLLGSAAIQLVVGWQLIKARKLRELCLGAMGFLPFFLIPLHNAWFGRKFVPLTLDAGNPFLLRIKPETYVEVAKGWLGGQGLPSYWPVIVDHYEKWLGPFPGVLVLLVSMAFALLPGRWVSTRIRALSLACAGLQLPSMFYAVERYDATGGRWTLCAWTVSSIVVICGIAHLLSVLRARELFPSIAGFPRSGSDPRPSSPRPRRKGSARRS